MKISGSGRQVARRHVYFDSGRQEKGKRRPGRRPVIRVQPPRRVQTHLTDGSQLGFRVWPSGFRAERGGSPTLLISFTGRVHKLQTDPPSRGRRRVAPDSHHPPPLQTEPFQHVTDNNTNNDRQLRTRETVLSTDKPHAQTCALLLS